MAESGVPFDAVHAAATENQQESKYNDILRALDQQGFYHCAMPTIGAEVDACAKWSGHAWTANGLGILDHGLDSVCLFTHLYKLAVINANLARRTVVLSRALQANFC